MRPKSVRPVSKIQIANITSDPPQRRPLGLIVLTMALAANPAKAQTVAAGPYYANPSWDQTLACTTLANCPRFIVLSNMGSNAVLDRETGLVWERNPLHSTNLGVETRNWLSAQALCRNLTTGNRIGWRLPTVQELQSLVDPSVTFPSLPPGHPFTNVRPSTYWSASTFASDTTFAFAVDFFGPFNLPNGDITFVIGAAKSRDDFGRVWCVRGGSGVDPQ